LAEAGNRNVKLGSLAFGTVSKCLTTLGEDLQQIQPAKAGSPPLEPLVTEGVKALLKGKLASLRDSAKECLETVIKVTGGFPAFEATYGPKIGQKDMVQLLSLLGLGGEAGGKPLPGAVPKRPSTAKTARSSFPAKRPAAAVSGRATGGGFGMMEEENDEEVVIKPKHFKKKEEESNEQGKEQADVVTVANDAVGRLRKNSTTPRSRKSADDVMMEF